MDPSPRSWPAVLIPLVAFQLLLSGCGESPAGNAASAASFSTKRPSPFPTQTWKPPTPLPSHTPALTELPPDFLHGKIVYLTDPDPAMQWVSIQLWALDPEGQQTRQLTSDPGGIVKVQLPEELPWKLGVVSRTLPPQLTHEALFRFSPPEGWHECEICVLSPSGSWLAHATDQELFVVDMTSGRVDEVMSRGGTFVVSGRWLSSGPDFFYAIGGEGEAYYIFDAVTQQNDYLRMAPAGWNSTDTRVAGLKHDPREMGWATNDVLAYELDTGRTYSAATAADETLPIWAPDGRHVFYMRRAITASEVPGENEDCYGQTQEWALAGPAEIWWLDSDTGRSSLVLRSGLFNYMVEKVIENTVVVKTAPYEPRSFDKGCGPSDFAPGGYTEGDNFVLNLSTFMLEPYDRTKYELVEPWPPTQPPPVTVFEDSRGTYIIEYRQILEYGQIGGHSLAAHTRLDGDQENCYYNWGSLWKVWSDGRQQQLVKGGCFYTYLP